MYRAPSNSSPNSTTPTHKLLTLSPHRALGHCTFEGGVMSWFIPLSFNPSLSPDTSTCLWIFWNSLQPTWVVSHSLLSSVDSGTLPFYIQTFLYSFLMISFHLSLDPQPSISTSVIYPCFQTPMWTTYIAANTVGTPQLDLWGLPLCQVCSLSSLFHVYAIELRITTVSVCHIYSAQPCLRVSLYASGLVSVSPSQYQKCMEVWEVSCWLWAWVFLPEIMSARYECYGT